MGLAWRFRIALVVALTALALAWAWMGGRKAAQRRSTGRIADLSVTSPLNLPGEGAAPDEAYEIYSALYHGPQTEPLAFGEKSVTDIPQLDGSCLKPATGEEQEMADAFAAANRQRRQWEKRFAIPSDYLLLTEKDSSEAQGCMARHETVDKCARYSGLQHVRYLGIPGFNRDHTRALVSVIRWCGSYCGSGGIFEVEKISGKWRHAEPSGFTRQCSWMY